MDFIGRVKEMKIINDLLGTDTFESLLIYGRKRVGKSEMIKKSLRDSKLQSLYYECKQTSEMNNVESVSRLISEQLNLPKLAFSSFEDILEFIFKNSQNTKQVLVLDEYSYLSDKIKGIDSILQSLIDTYKDSSQLKLVICGSYVDMMKNLVAHHNPLYGRFSRIIDLKQMDYYDSSLFYKEFSNEDKVRLYSVFGGIPYYNQLIDQKKTVRQNIIDLIASPGSRLENEVTMYLKSEISKIVNANEVFESMVMGNSKYNDIYSNSHVTSGPTLIDVLDKLIKMEVVIKESPINDENNRKKSGYFICDNLTFFYYKYIFRFLSQMQVMDPSVFYENYIQQDFEKQYVPLMFERVCKQYLIRLNRENKLEVPFHKIGKYYYDDPINKKNGEFDIVSEDKKGYIFYECKFKDTKITRKMMEEEIEQVKETGLSCYKYGFFSKSGFDEFTSDELILVQIDDLYEIDF